VKRTWWMVIAGLVVVAGLAVGVREVSGIVNGVPSGPDLNGQWEFTGRVVGTWPDGGRERERVEGELWIKQYSSGLTYLTFYLDQEQWGFQGMLGEKHLLAASAQGVASLRLILDARVNRRASRLSGRIRGVETSNTIGVETGGIRGVATGDGEGMFLDLSFKATRAPT